MTFNHAKLRNPVSHENILIVFTGALDFFCKDCEIAHGKIIKRKGRNFIITV